MATHEAKFEPQSFSLKSQLLSHGSYTTNLAQSELLSVAVKVYAAGGENTMHQHPEEDHSFIVLQGQATFHVGSDENLKVINKNEGIMLPAGSCYWFLSSAKENLVMVRVGAARQTPQVWRAFADGRPFDSEELGKRKEKQKLLAFVPDQYFGA